MRTIGVKNLLRKIKHRKQNFGARMEMERTAQADIDARLKRLDLAYRNKTRQGNR